MFCPSCGKEIPDHSAFCLACGRSIATGKDSSTVEPGKKHFNATGIIVIALLVAIAVIVYVNRPSGEVQTPKATFESPVPPVPAPVVPPPPRYITKTETLFTNQLVVRHGNMLWKTFKVDTSVMSDVRVFGKFRASGGSGNDIQAGLMNEDNFENWKNGHPANVLYSAQQMTVGDVDVNITESGTYYFCFNNRFALFSDKDVFAEITLQYKVRQ
jgi:hypothetical protein